MTSSAEVLSAYVRERKGFEKEVRECVFGRWGVVLRALEVRGREESVRHCVQNDFGVFRTTVLLRENILNFYQALQLKSALDETTVCFVDDE